MNNVQIAQTILEQIKASDKMALWAWGAKKFVALDTGRAELGGDTQLGGVKFSVNGLKYNGTVMVRLMANDTYTVEIGRPYKGQFKVKSKLEGVYCDMLADIIDGLVER
jgi:hypothetical protein